MAEYRTRIFACGLALGAVAGIGFLIVTGSVVDGIEPVQQLEGYRVGYRVDDRSGTEPQVRRQTLEVGRPYDARIEEGRSASISSGRVQNREYSWELGEDGEPRFGSRRPPGAPARDISYAALTDAAAAGAIAAVGRGESLGRTCTWFVSENPFPQPLTPATKLSRTETCVDPAGVMLREVWTISAKLVRSIDAVTFEDKRPSKKRFLTGKKPSKRNVSQPDASNLVDAQIVVADDVDVGRPKIRLQKPAGWKTDRSSVVVQAAPGAAQPSQFTSTAYVRGSDIVVVDLGLRPEVAPPWASDEGRPVAFGDDDARIVYSADRIELRIITRSGFARILARSRSSMLSFSTRLNL